MYFQPPPSPTASLGFHDFFFFFVFHFRYFCVFHRAVVVLLFLLPSLPETPTAADLGWPTPEIVPRVTSRPILSPSVP